MDLLDILFILCAMFCVFKCGELYGYWEFFKVINEYLESKGINLEQELKNKSLKEDPKDHDPKIHKLEVHEENNMLYLYNRDNDSFICQAPTIEEIAKLAKEYKNITAAAVVYGKKVFLFQNGDVKEYT